MLDLARVKSSIWVLLTKSIDKFVLQRNANLSKQLALRKHTILMEYAVGKKNTIHGARSNWDFYEYTIYKADNFLRHSAVCHISHSPARRQRPIYGTINSECFRMPTSYFTDINNFIPKIAAMHQFLAWTGVKKTEKATISYRANNAICPQ